jgi:hypothetical protein
MLDFVTCQVHNLEDLLGTQMPANLLFWTLITLSPRSLIVVYNKS